MAYVPPHRRDQSKMGVERCSPPKPECFQMRPLFNINNPNSKYPRRRNAIVLSFPKIIYANEAISRWFPVGFNNNDDRSKFPDYVTLQPVSYDSVVRKFGENALALILNDVVEDKERVEKSPWDHVAENVVKDLLTSFECVRREIMSNESEELRPTLVARFGKIIFRRDVSEPQDLTCDEDTLRGLKRTFNTSIPKSYMEHILSEVSQKIGFEFAENKDLYHVKLFNHSRPESIICCKCKVLKDGKLKLYQTKLNQERHMVTDISCLDKNVDLRLMLCAKKITTSLTDDDMQSIRKLIAYASLDDEVKGGLRWPFGKSSLKGFRVVEAWHTTTKSYVNQSKSMKLKVRDADRFNLITSLGEKTREVVVKLKRIASELKDESVDEYTVKEMLKDDLKVLWDNFFWCESFVKW